ncbi:MAG: hypothetical protein M1830_009211 [Pleopsidium flavum]|nr:MAG: hypothetical protein M1830_009211 [Pleopsidium flavum]
MAVSKKRSLSDLQDSDDATEKDKTIGIAHKASSLDLQGRETEEELDTRLEREAADLGIHVEKTLLSTPVNGLRHNVPALVPSSAVLEPSLSSRFSQSTHPTSCSSSEQQAVTKTSSLSTSSLPSATPSLLSYSSKKSSYLKIKRSFRRISGFRRKKTIGYLSPSLPLIIPKGPTAVQDEQNILAKVVSIKKRSVSEQHEGLKDAVLASEQFTLSAPPTDPAAIRRSLENGQLKFLRAKQLEEQARFIELQQHEQRRDLRTNHESQMAQVSTRYRQLEHSTREGHHQAMITMEDRHLSAEVDLHRTLELERQACETRLRHMEAYCNSPLSITGMPIRTVTDKDFRELAQQYHVRDSMESLHDSRINVLREKQAKQVERVTAKQDEELANLADRHRSELADLDLKFHQSVAEAQHAFEERKHRLDRKWLLAEAVARRRLEIETDEQYAPLPPITW